MGNYAIAGMGTHAIAVVLRTGAQMSRHVGIQSMKKKGEVRPLCVVVKLGRIQSISFLTKRSEAPTGRW
ncbi:MAG: hypothetical protein AAFP83_02675 [Bacteroidota bacterium]